MKKQNNKSVLHNWDFFGTTPHLLFNNDRQYRSNSGFLFSFLCSICVIIACWIYGKELFYKEHPRTTQSEIRNSHHEKFSIKQNKFNFAFGLQDNNATHFSDPRVFNVTIRQELHQKQDPKANLNHNMGNPEYNYLDVRKCQFKDFELDKEFFHSLQGFKDLYCIGKEEGDIFLEGDYEDEIFSQIQVLVRPCQKGDLDEEGKQIECLPDEQIKEILEHNYWAFYITDSVVNPHNVKESVTYYGRNIYGLSSFNQFQQIDLNYRNVYLNDNKGLFFDEVNQERYLQYQYKEVFNSNAPNSKDGSFLKFNIRFEKFKETQIFRSYLNISEVLASLGGILKFILIFFSIFSSFVSVKLYNLDIINDIFKFEIKSDKRKTKNGKKQYKKQQLDKLEFDSVLQVIFPCFMSRKHKQKKLLMDKAIEQIGNTLNVQKIINTVLEVQKLKKIIFTDQQQQLFECLPQPIISYRHIDEQLTKQSHHTKFHRKKLHQSSFEEKAVVNNLEISHNRRNAQDIESQRPQSQINLINNSHYSYQETSQQYQYYQQQKQQQQKISNDDLLDQLYSSSEQEDPSLKTAQQAYLKRIRSYRAYKYIKQNELDKDHISSQILKYMDPNLKEEFKEQLLVSKHSTPKNYLNRQINYNFNTNNNYINTYNNINTQQYNSVLAPPSYRKIKMSVCNSPLSSQNQSVSNLIQNCDNQFLFPQNNITNDTQILQHNNNRNSVFSFGVELSGSKLSGDGTDSQSPSQEQGIQNKKKKRVKESADFAHEQEQLRESGEIVDNLNSNTEKIPVFTNKVL